LLLGSHRFCACVRVLSSADSSGVCVCVCVCVGVCVCVCGCVCVCVCVCVRVQIYPAEGQCSCINHREALLGRLWHLSCVNSHFLFLHTHTHTHTHTYTHTDTRIQYKQ